MSNGFREDIEQRAASDGVVETTIAEQTGGQPVCPSIPEVIYAEFPATEIYGQIIEGVVDTAGSLSTLVERVINPPSGADIEQEVSNTFSSASSKFDKALQRVGGELKNAAQQIAVEAEQAIIEQLNVANTFVYAVRSGVIQLGTDLQNIDQITLNAFAREFPGFKNAIDCWKGGEEGSSTRESSAETAEEQAAESVPLNPATPKTEIATSAPRPPDPIRDIQTGVAAGGSLQSALSEYPHVLADPNDSDIVYAVYPKNLKFIEYDISSGKPDQVGFISEDFDELNAKFPNKELKDLPVLSQPYTETNAEEAEAPLTELPE